MNTMGKILVFLVLLLALAVGGFLAVDVATRQNWHEAFQKQAEELTVARANETQLNNTVATVMQQLKEEQAKAKDLEARLAKANAALQQHDAELKSDLSAATLNTEKADVLTRSHLEEMKRLKKENAALLKVVQERDQTIVKLNEERNKAQDKMYQALSEAEAMRQRNESLLNHNRELEIKLAKQKVTGATGASLTPAVRGPDQPNPPAAYVRGKVTKVDAEDPDLLVINIGTDNGVRDGQTLDVYRLSPEPQYIGMLRIRSADHHQSVAHMVRSRIGGARREVRVGDEVASSIQPPR
jgi:hypothetical protein